MIMENEPMENRIIKLPKGGELEVSLTPAFLEVVKNHFKLNDISSVHDDHIQIFIYGSTKNALDRESPSD